MSERFPVRLAKKNPETPGFEKAAVSGINSLSAYFLPPLLAGLAAAVLVGLAAVVFFF